jgi:hypothetical protein
VRNKEEIELAIDDLRLLNEAVVDVSALRRVGNVGITGSLVVVSAMRRLLILDLEESLANTLVDDDECRFGQLDLREFLGRGLLLFDFLSFLVFGFRLSLLAFLTQRVLLLHDLVQLLQLMLDDLAPHRVADAVSVNEDVVGQRALVVVSECLECILEVLLQHTAADDFLAFLPLRAGLSVVFTHVLVIGGAESDDGLLTFVADIDANEHSLF